MLKNFLKDCKIELKSESFAVSTKRDRKGP
jgi:hypothetical protein